MFKNIFNKFIIIFFYFFFISRFFSEKLKILPKYIDLINFPLFFIIFFLFIVSINKKIELDEVYKKIFRFVVFFSATFLISIVFNSNRVLMESSLLFYIGFLEGPFLFLTLEKMVNDQENFIKNIDKIFLVLLLINLILIFTIDLPEFLLTGNPDVISGTYGYNTYQFSFLLMICGGYLLGYNYVKRYRASLVIISQVVILAVFYLSQFRAALPFFLTSYLLMLGFLYGKKLVYKLIPIVAIIIFITFSIIYFSRTNDKIEGLKFSDWYEILNNPMEFLTYGKFKIYNNVLDMWSDYPETSIIGTGPGNFMSRANYTFSYELNIQGKGVSSFVKDFFGIKAPYFTNLHMKYIYNGIKVEPILGTYQLSNPYTSYLSSITEIGIFGGISIVLVYLFLALSSIRFLKIIRENNPNFIPLSVALIGATSYVFMLAFLENYWEMARITLPLWLLFWTVNKMTNLKVNE